MSAFQHMPPLLESFSLLLVGAGMTIAVSLAGNALGLLIAVPVCLLRLARGRGARALGGAYVSFFRGDRLGGLHRGLSGREPARRLPHHSRRPEQRGARLRL